MPRTAVSYTRAWRLTIKLDEIEPHRLAKRAARLFLDQHTHLLGAALVVLQEEEHGQRYKRQDDGKRSVAPAPVGLVELFGNLGTSVGSNDPWRGRKGKRQTSVLELGRVGGEHVDRKDDTDESNAVKDLPLLALFCANWLTCAAQ